jgi:hypothetical protein
MAKTNWPLGSILPNGAKVIIHNDNYVLAETATSSTHTEFVTWSWDSAEPESCYWGHYFNNTELLKAVQDFEERTQRSLH